MIEIRFPTGSSVAIPASAGTHVIENDAGLTRRVTVNKSKGEFSYTVEPVSQ